MTAPEGQLAAAHVPAPNSSCVLALEGLRLGQIDALEPLQLALQVACSRCGTRASLALSSVSLTQAAAAARTPVVTAAATCVKCAQAMEVAVAPHLLHERSNVLAHVTPTGCAPADLLPCSFGAQCGGCGAAVALRGVQVRPGEWLDAPARLLQDTQPLPRHTHGVRTRC